MNFFICFCLLLSCCDLVYPYVFPSVKKCRYTDSNCLKSSFQNALPSFADGIPELGIAKMDELVINDKTYKLGGLDFTIKDGRLKGLKSTIFDYVSMDMDKKVLRTDYHVQKCSMSGKYLGVGNIKVLPLKGGGEMFLKFRNVAISQNVTFDMEKRENGKVYMIPKKYEFDFDVKDHAHFNLTNLFNGNEELGETVLTFLNNNWKDVSSEFGRPMMEQQASQIFSHVVKYLSNSPVDEIFAQ
ncbi:circadian clock-controlled protein daywake-like [Zerene cesonia]|uniref:circadian clock-controlled protein daywake-like n=1 Tax=Zerene cesonia TaxID=33412 RepID=UPI0018E59052|nr:circadian clock-controlled protein daywake-like [Zerene cesonia]